jgi:hypothetical protein
VNHQPGWPQWLSVPAAPDRSWTAKDGAPRAQLLKIVADHGVAQRLASGMTVSPQRVFGLVTPAQVSTSWSPGRNRPPTSMAEQCGTLEGGGRDLHNHSQGWSPGELGFPDGSAVLACSLLDLGRHSGARIDPAAQRFDLGLGTFDSRLGAAMNPHQLDLALSAGRHAVERAKLDGVDLIQAQGAGAGAVITNQVWRQLLRRWSESCITEGSGSRLPCKAELSEHRARSAGHTEAGDRRRNCALASVADGNRRMLACGPSLGCCGYGRRLHDQSALVVAAVEDPSGPRAVESEHILRRHAAELSEPYEALRRLGGFEHAALVGSALAAAQLGLRWLAAGESAEIAGLLALRINPSVETLLRKVHFGCVP